MKVCRITSLIAICLGFTVIEARTISEVDRLWKARGLQANEEMLRIFKQLPAKELFKAGGKKVNTIHKKLSCQLALEEAFSLFATEGLNDILSKDRGAAQDFRLIFRSEGKIWAQVNFLYDKKTGLPILVETYLSLRKL
jgi:hypothetical protein